MIKYKIVFTDDITKENIFCQLFKASKFVNKIINNRGICEFVFTM